MRAALHVMLASGVEGELPDWQPEDPECFGLHLQVLLGPEGTTSSDSFDVGVCTPLWFVARYEATQLRRWSTRPLYGTTALLQLSGHRDLSTAPEISEERYPALFGTGFIFLRRWDYAKLEATIQELCANTKGPTWGAVASRIGRLLPWEFDYRYDRAIDAGEEFPTENRAPEETA
ncbi:MAG TPA: Imm8 family immunity protein [Solirubrobacteraceae bacterium]